MENFCKVGKMENKNGYDVCRGVKSDGDLRYDLTLIYAKDEQGELPRTTGHYHTKGFAELFEVIEGRTMVLMQKHKKEPNDIDKVYIIEAKAGEKLIVLPDFGFTNINAEKSENLLLSNWVDIKVENKYDFIKQYSGFCYRALRGENDGIIFEKNDEYQEVPEVIRVRPKEFPKELEDLDFLSNPEKYKNFLTIEHLYEVI